MNVQGGVANAIAQFLEIPPSGYLAGTPITLAQTRLLSYFLNGTGVDQIDGFSGLLLNLVAGTPQDINISTLTDPFTNPLTVARVPYFAAKNLSSVDGQVMKIGGAGAGEWDGFLSSGGKLSVFPSSPLNDGFLELCAPGLTANPVNSGGSGSIALNWTPVTGATGYKIYRSTTTGGEHTSPALLTTLSPGSTASYTDTGSATSSGATPSSNTATLAAPTPSISILGVSGGSFAAAGTYYYEVSALTAAGESTPSSQASTTVTTVNTVPISWAAVPGATGYKIYRSTTSGGENTSPALLTTISSGATTSYLDTGTATTAGATTGSSAATLTAPSLIESAGSTGGTLAAGTYYYEITATTASGESTPSGEVSGVIVAASNILKVDPGANSFQAVLLFGTRSV